MRTIKPYIVIGVALLLLALEIAAVQLRSGGVAGRGVGSPVGASEVSLTPSPAPPVQGTVSPPRGYMPPWKSDTDLTTMRPTGVPAIKPTIPGAGPTTPAFTVADVTAYHTTYHTVADISGYYGVGDYASSVLPRIVKVEFLTEKALRARIPDSTGLPDDTLLCYVQYSGSFVLVPPPGVQRPVSIWPYAIEVFDAHTGNRMIAGLAPTLR